MDGNRFRHVSSASPNRPLSRDLGSVKWWRPSPSLRVSPSKVSPLSKGLFSVSPTRWPQLRRTETLAGSFQQGQPHFSEDHSTARLPGGTRKTNIKMQKQTNTNHNNPKSFKTTFSVGEEEKHHLYFVISFCFQKHQLWGEGLLPSASAAGRLKRRALQKVVWGAGGR